MNSQPQGRGARSKNDRHVGMFSVTLLILLLFGVFVYGRVMPWFAGPPADRNSTGGNWDAAPVASKHLPKHSAPGFHPNSKPPSAASA